jgi:hypothetical protein
VSFSFCFRCAHCRRVESVSRAKFTTLCVLTGSGFNDDLRVSMGQDLVTWLNDTRMVSQARVHPVLHRSLPCRASAVRPALVIASALRMWPLPPNERRARSTVEEGTHVSRVDARQALEHCLARRVEINLRVAGLAGQRRLRRNQGRNGQFQVYPCSAETPLSAGRPSHASESSPSLRRPATTPQGE